MSKIKLEDLSPEDRAKLVAQAKAEDEAKKQKVIDDRKAYKELSQECVPELFQTLQAHSRMLSDLKRYVFETLKNVIDLKVEAYGVREGQQSHTFSNNDSTQSVTIGYRIVDRWDDTHQAGIEKINQFLASLSVDKKTEQLIKAINRLLQKDANGNLKSSRVLELEQIAQDFNNPDLDDAISIIRKSYKPAKTCYFIEAKYTDKTGKSQSLPLSISTVDFPEGTEIDFM